MRATPKSASFTRRCASSITFAGFTSRWITPASCAKSSASSSSPMMRTASAGVEPFLRLEEAAQLAPLDELHHQVGDVVLHAEVVHLDDVRVVEPRDRLRLAGEPGRSTRVRSPSSSATLLQDGLDRDPAVQRRVEALIDDTHRALAEDRDAARSVRVWKLPPWPTFPSWHRDLDYRSEKLALANDGHGLRIQPVRSARSLYA